ncbi:PEPxxWA-CTERM sorting domain-containing protein [Sphingomonas sp. AP4-R1]|uniref:PEPxxWA-CTERM sorting domain-containing protein n=1 Tax=Sphingomonas sp. AP4-R1 TaxID=2735134 RepID=UPI001493BC8C|nr:PEPxxWA-CTERM sorting domain-containing protein [Sphingomonas sp. AP4-R1]QJU59794.1 PEPxxWA-CTERM sorting domain-containing protein [Sphingomonas sp. AP4-R1]
MIRAIAGLAFFLVGLLSNPVRASVIYKLDVIETFIGLVGSVEITQPDYITSYVNFPENVLTNCSVTGAGSVACFRAEFIPDIRNLNIAVDDADYVGFYGRDNNNNSFGAIFVLTNGALSTPGVYMNLDELDYESARLTIIDTSIVPEPATWAAFIVGFLLIGGMLRASRDHSGARPISLIASVRWPRPIG